MKRHIPNSLTLLRIILVPVFIWFALLDHSDLRFFWAALVFILASITDYYDGLLARRLKAISNFGKIMDPLADKILVLSALLALAMSDVGLVPPAVFAIVTIREIFVSVLRNRYARRGIFISADFWGKLKTCLQMIGVIAALVYKAFSVYVSLGFETHFKTAFHICFWLVALLTVFSGIKFFISAMKIEEIPN